ITYLNDAACELFGLAGEDSIGKQLDERVRGLDWNALTHSGGPVTRDLEIFYPRNRFINFYSVPLLIEPRDASVADDSGNHQSGSGQGATSAVTTEQVGYAIIMRDITESRRTAEKTIESERLNALTLLAAGVAHELGNPLNSLNIHLQLMGRQARKMKGKAREELQYSIDICRGEINRLGSIVSQFLRAIRPSHPLLRPENINAIVEEAVHFFSAEIEARDIVVETELHSDLPLLQLD